MARYDGPIIDVDIHHRWERDEELIPFLPTEWRSYVVSDPSRIWPPANSGAVQSNGARIRGTLSPELPGRGTKYEVFQRTHLDRHNHYRCVLTFDVGSHGSHVNRYFGNAVARAANDWNVQSWLPRDNRFYSVVSVNAGAPDEAAKEIRRVGKHPQLVAVALTANLLGRPWGDPVYDPIYEAASEMGLHIGLHYGGFDRPGTGVTAVGGRLPSGLVQFSQFSQQAMHYISSFIVHGTFEKFPGLRVLVKEYGVAWLPYLMTRLDNNRDLLAAESPWIKKWPSEYIRSNIKLSTQPLEESPDPKSFVQLMETIDQVEEMLCFSSDWPHWTADDAAYVAKVLPKRWHRKVFCTNACDFYDWTYPAEEWSVANTAVERTGAGVP